jgi:arsenate reductase
MLKVYTLSNCSTCRKATQWLRARGIEFDERAIRETPPTRAELKTMLAARDGQLKRLFNTSGEDYRAQKLNEKLPSLSEAESLALLASNGRLVKRPFAIGDGVALTGFDEKAWAAAFAKPRA